MDLRRYGEHAVVTGAAQGIGRAFAYALARSGLDVTIVDRQREVLERVAGDLRHATGQRIQSVVADLADAEAVSRVVESARQTPVDILVCNAAISPIDDFTDQTLAVHREVFDVNCRSALELLHPISQAMVERRRGAVVLMSSGSALCGSPRIAHYAATKAYLKTLGEGLWDELRPYGVDVVVALPGLVRTPALEASSPRSDGLRGLPVLEPDQVARETLAALGKGPLFFPGSGHRLAMRLTHVLPTRVARWVTARQVRKLYPG